MGWSRATCSTHLPIFLFAFERFCPNEVGALGMDVATCESMITLHRLNGQIVAINPDLITWIDVTPDTTVSLLGGDRIMVRESLDEVIDAIVGYRASIRALAGTVDSDPPTEMMADHARALRHSYLSNRSSRNPERVTVTPSYPPRERPSSLPPDSTSRSRT
jgi:flagellar protein FlbD